MEGPLLKNRYCSENLYKKQKETISKINSEKKSNTQNYPPKTVQSNQRVVKFSPDNNQWVYTTFSTLLNKKTKEESPLIVNDTWSESNAKASNGIELRNLIFQTEETFNYYITYNKIKANVILKNDSSFWIFLHSQNSFSERTATIHFSKEEFSQRIFISFGIFYNKDTELLYKELNKEMFFSMHLSFAFFCSPFFIWQERLLQNLQNLNLFNKISKNCQHLNIFKHTRTPNLVQMQVLQNKV